MNTHSSPGQRTIAIGLMLLGGYVLAGWIAGNESMVRIIPSSVAMGLNSACLFIAYGICLWPAGREAKPTAIEVVLPWVMILLPAAVLLEHALDVNLGIDWVSLHARVRDGNPQPGRIAPNTSVSFLAAGGALLLLARDRTDRLSRLAAASLVGVTFLIGLVAFIGYAVELESMYRLAVYNRMAAATAVALTLGGTGLWLRLRELRLRADGDVRPDTRITRTAAMVLTLVVLLTGLIGFLALKQAFERSTSTALLRSTQNYAATLAAEIHQQIAVADVIASGSVAPARPVASEPAPMDDEARRVARNVAQSLQAAGFSGVQVTSDQGEDIATAGTTLRRSATLAVPLHAASGRSVQLLWSNGFVLLIERPLLVEGRNVGTFVAERRVDTLGSALRNARQGSDSTDMLVCGRSGPDAVCFPSWFYTTNFRIPMYKDGKVNLAIPRALLGQQGVIAVKDLRGVPVLAGYSPVADFGLGLVVKTDALEFYTPIRERLNGLMVLLALIIAAATLVLRAQVRPLARRLHDDHQRMQAIIESSHEAFIELNQAGLVTDWNAEAERTFGWTRAEAMGQALTALVIPAAMGEAHARGIATFLKTGQGPVLGKRIELPAVHRNGREFVVELTISAIQDDNGYRFTAFLHDISERKAGEAKLLAEEERLRVTLSSIGDGVITTDTLGNVNYLNPVAEDMTGWQTAQAIGLPLATVFRIVNENTGETAPNPVEQVLLNEKTAGLAQNTTLLHRDGSRFPIEDSASPIRDPQGRIVGVVLVFHDVSQARKMAAEMTHQATHDALTGLINRREFERRLDLALVSAQLEHKQHSLLYLDLDQFKVVNDTCGHVAGDELLRQLTALLQDKLRKSDTFARLGGDEFGVLLVSCGTEPALRIAESLRQTVGDFHFVWLDKVFPVGASIGLVTFSDGGVTLSDVMRMADAACYVAKEKGRNRIQVYTAEDEELARRSGEMGWIGRIQKALDENRFVLYSQKILALGGDPEGGDHYELLLRMRDEAGELVPPMAFIPAAERYGLMPQLDRWVIKSAFANYAAGNPGGKSSTCAINLSAKSICDEGFCEFVLDQFRHWQVPPTGICFEITETAAIANLSQATKLIRDLKAVGCRFALDDFGSGMSSFAYLKHLGVDYLKIDGGFVKDMLEDPIDHAMVTSIYTIGHVMGIRTIAEFVENDAILAALRDMGVDFAQGYGVEKPRPAW